MPTRPLERRDAPAGLRRLACPLTLRQAGEDGAVEGYGSVWGVRDSYDDVVAKGAFAASLAAHRGEGTMPALLWQHDPDEPIGVWSQMVEDETGLKVAGQLVLDTARGREAHALLKAGALNGLSIGFVSRQWSYDRESEVRTLTEIDLWEVSLVTFPANGKARITGVKASDVDTFTKPSEAERWLREAAPGLSRGDATAFVSRVMRMGEERREAAQSTLQAQRAAERLLASLQS